MTTSILNVTESKTYKAYQILRDLGFNVTLSSTFTYSYDKGNNYLAITVKDADLRLNELFEAAPEFEILLTKYVNSDKVSFEARKNANYAEFVSEEVWMNYYNSILV